ncbi:MAG: hypothetical protein FJX64_06655 [Alphaproteobacteria bacterium]|nr:hypothetical protein [Alphaproteobacteria bacterium]
MTKVTLVAAAAFALTLASTAFAAETIGEVRTWNEQERMLTLGNGERYEIGQNIALPNNLKLEPGVRVKLTYDIDRAEQNLRKVTLIEFAPEGAPAQGQPAPTPAAR